MNPIRKGGRWMAWRNPTSCTRNSGFTTNYAYNLRAERLAGVSMRSGPTMLERISLEIMTLSTLELQRGKPSGTVFIARLRSGKKPCFAYAKGKASGTRAAGIFRPTSSSYKRLHALAGRVAARPRFGTVERECVEKLRKSC